MRAFLTIWLLISIVLIWVSYEPQESDDFYDIKGLNSELKSKLDLDLLEIKRKTDSVYEIDTSFYRGFMLAPYETYPFDYFELANIPFDPVDSKGLKLNDTKHSDSLARIMMLSLADNVKVENCNSKSKDSLCIYKFELKRILHENNPKKDHMTYMFFSFILKRLIDKDYLSEEELNYLILYNHYLGRLLG